MLQLAQQVVPLLLQGALPPVIPICRHCRDFRVYKLFSWVRFIGRASVIGLTEVITPDYYLALESI